MVPAPTSDQAAQRRQENLGQVFQEIITVIERLRSNRQMVNDANAFRQQMRDALRNADQEARKRGYSAEEIQLAIFAVVGFLDESILNLRHPVFSDWPRQPLQEELFGHQLAGEIFFQNLQKLIGQNDSQVLADVIEVYYLCLLLGFAGRYSMGGRGELREIMDRTAAKIRRIRGSGGELSPSWKLPPAQARTIGGDPFVKYFLIGAAALVLLAVGLFFIYKAVLGGGISSLAEIAAKSRL